MVPKVWSGLFHHQRLTILLKLLHQHSNCMTQEFNSGSKQALAANNRRLGLVLLSVVVIFFIGIVIKRSVLS